MPPTSSIKWYEGALHELLQGRGGPVARDLAARAERIASQARTNASGPPHGYYRGRRYPSAARTGVGPGVRSGLGRSGIGWVFGVDAQGIYADIGSSQPYMGILEVTQLYPWLLRALPAGGG